MTTRPALSGVALLVALNGVANAQSGDTSNSTMVITHDSTTYLTAEGTLRADQFNGDRDLLAVLQIPGVSWNFDITILGFFETAGLYDFGMKLAGTHIHGPHHDDSDPNPLPEKMLSAANPGFIAIKWDKKVPVSFGSSVDHPAGGETHKDWYGIFYNPVAKDRDADGNPKRVEGWAGLIGLHRGKDNDKFDPGWATCAWSEREGTRADFKPETGLLTVTPGPIDIADQDGGRSLMVDPRYADDPILGLETKPVVMELKGFDPETGEYVFGAAELHTANPVTGLSIDALIPEFRISSTLPDGKLGALGSFDPVAIVNPSEDETQHSVWADDFSRTAWLAEGLSEDEFKRLRYPVLSLNTPLDLVDATNGFTAPAEVPATLMLTIAAGQIPPCPADLNGDGQVNTIDVLQFLNAWSAGEDSADWNGDGVINTIDVLQFLNDWAAGCE